MSTVVICSGCEKPKTQATNVLKVGVSADLLSFDPFSFQSLGERDVIDLLYGRLFEIIDDEIKSKYLKNIKIKKNKITFDKVDAELFGQMQAVFFKGQSSTLWKDVFNQFELKRSEIKFLKENDFIAQLKTLWPLLVFEKKGMYRVLSHIKGVSLSLEAQEEGIAKKLKLIRIKENQTGLDMLMTKELDYYFPSRPFSKGMLNAYKDLEVNYSKDELKLRMYHKYGEVSQLSKVYCNNQKDFEKLLGEDWVFEKRSCGNESLKKDLKVIYSDKALMKYLDFLHNRVREESGGSLSYDLKSSLEMGKILKMGQFNLHLSLEKVGDKTPVLKDSFHSRGRYNSYGLKDEKLDGALEKLSKALDLKEFKRFEEESRGRLFEIMPLTFSYKKPSVNYVKLKRKSSYTLKSSKRLIFFK